MIGPSASGVDEYGSCDCEPVSAGLPEAALAGERRDARALDHLKRAYVAEEVGFEPSRPFRSYNHSIMAIFVKTCVVNVCGKAS